ncbi:hypothetical protein EMIT0P12_60081 [Pseudomonas sp. IT-P12]
MLTVRFLENLYRYISREVGIRTYENFSAGVALCYHYSNYQY